MKWQTCADSEVSFACEKLVEFLKCQKSVNHFEGLNYETVIGETVIGTKSIIKNPATNPVGTPPPSTSPTESLWLYGRIMGRVQLLNWVAVTGPMPVETGIEGRITPPAAALLRPENIIALL